MKERWAPRLHSSWGMAHFTVTFLGWQGYISGFTDEKIMEFTGHWKHLNSSVSNIPSNFINSFEINIYEIQHKQAVRNNSKLH